MSREKEFMKVLEKGEDEEAVRMLEEGFDPFENYRENSNESFFLTALFKSMLKTIQKMTELPSFGNLPEDEIKDFFQICMNKCVSNFSEKNNALRIAELISRTGRLSVSEMSSRGIYNVELLTSLYNDGLRVTPRNGETGAIHEFAVNDGVSRETLEKLIELGWELDQEDSEGRTPLMLAADSSRFDNVIHLLNAGAHVGKEVNGRTAATEAASQGHSWLFSKLSALAESERSPGFDRSREIEKSFESAENIQKWVDGNRLPGRLMGECLKPFLSDSDESNGARLLRAVEEGEVEKVRALLEEGADPNSCDKTARSALEFAMSNDHPEIVRQLLNSGAQPPQDARNDGETLYPDRRPGIANIAFNSKNARMLEILKDTGYPLLKSSGEPLSEMVCGSPECAEFFLSLNPKIILGRGAEVIMMNLSRLMSKDSTKVRGLIEDTIVRAGGVRNAGFTGASLGSLVKKGYAEYAENIVRRLVDAGVDFSKPMEGLNSRRTPFGLDLKAAGWPEGWVLAEAYSQARKEARMMEEDAAPSIMDKKRRL